tara:strand:- start:2002 stop:4038 length:2037 start_codon:yes stop_codon:yes gene_type:complete
MLESLRTEMLRKPLLMWLALVVSFAPVLGAAKKGHWAFQDLAPMIPPEVSSALSDHPIDRFIRARQLKQSIDPVKSADRRTIIRRAYFDLIGLPPKPDRVGAFVAGGSGQSFAELVDELLESPRYGERWGRHWLDLARYADTAGENSDYPIPQAYLYRDYVIDSFNADKPYDQFIKEQIAGDIIGRAGKPEDYAERLIATGFLAQAKRFGTDDLEDMHLIIEDTLDTMGKVVMGVGFSCARCHDHKYDPTSMKDYYGLYAFFDRTAYPFPGGEAVKVQKYFAPRVHPSILEPKDRDYFAKHQTEIERLKNRIKAKVDPKSDQLKLDEIDAKSPSRMAPMAYAVLEKRKAKDTYIHKLGNPRNRGDKVDPHIPAFIGGELGPIPPRGSGRLQLAEWLTSTKNPLTARVMMNRIWQHHFGKPIVSTPSNFGLNGETPSHPRLLDWLANEFIRSGWSIKAMHRLIMSSKTWQLASHHNVVNAAKDSDNATYWRFDRRRLDAEAIRDSMLLLGENLDLKRPGPHPFPGKKYWRFTAHHQFKAVYPSKHRSVYLMVQRLHPHPYLAIFNGPDTSATTARRDRSTVPLQALFMSNSEFVNEQAKGLASALLDAERDPTRRVHSAYTRVLSREPTTAEVKRAHGYIGRYAELLGQEGIPGRDRAHGAWSSFVKTLLTSNEFVFVD